MRLAVLQFLFRCTARLCKVTQAIHAGAEWLHTAAWLASTRENLRTCNDRQPARTSF
jgi:hypothetical protein